MGAGLLIDTCCRVIELKNGFVVTGKPSVALSPKPESLLVGEQIAYNNAYEKLREPESYLTMEHHHHASVD